MKAVTYHGKRDVRVDTVPDPVIQEPTDAIVRITSTASAARTCTSTRCSARSSTRATSSATSRWASSRRSAPSVEHIAPGDRVVIPFNISCGHCCMCDQGLQSQCETTQVREQGKGAALFGYTKLYGQVPGRAGRVPARAAGALRPDQGPRRAARRALRLPLRRAADRVAGGRVRRRSPRAAPSRCFGLGPIGQMCRADREAPRRRPGVRRSTSCPSGSSWRERHGVETIDIERESTTSATRAARSHRRPRARLRDRRGRDGGARRAARRARPEAVGLPARRDRPPADREGGASTGIERPARGDRQRAPRRHDLAQRRLRRPAGPDADDGPVRQADPAAHGPGQRPRAGSTT